jgi:hypothetical protein
LFIIIRIYTNLPLKSAVQIYKAQRNVILCISACLLYWYMSGLEAFENAWFIYLQFCHVPLYTYMCLQVCLSCMQILQGDSELGGSREEVQGSVVFPHLPHFITRGWEVAVLCFVLNMDITTRYAVMLQIRVLYICKFIFCACGLYFSYY